VLPELAIVADAFQADLAGRRVRGGGAPGPLAVRGTPAELEALVGQRLVSLRRRGKLLVAQLDRDRVVINPMLTGRLQLAAPGEIDALYAATRATVTNAIGELRTRVPPTFEKQARDWLAVHDKGGEACPRCGARISEVKPGGFVTSFCRGCQH
jgi:formamidopyrimidine-DNA glycosylase